MAIRPRLSEMSLDKFPGVVRFTVFAVQFFLAFPLVLVAIFCSLILPKKQSEYVWSLFDRYTDYVLRR